MVKRSEVSAVRRDGVNVSLRYLLLITPNTVESIHKRDRTNNIDGHEVPDFINDREYDINQRSNLAD